MKVLRNGLFFCFYSQPDMQRARVAPARLANGTQRRRRRGARVSATAAQDGGLDALTAYAEFLDRHHNPAAREAYEKL